MHFCVVLLAVVLAVAWISLPAVCSRLQASWPGRENNTHIDAVHCIAQFSRAAESVAVRRVLCG